MRTILFLALCLSLCSCVHPKLIGSGVQPRDFKDISRPERHDPIEDDPRFSSVFQSIDDETTAALERKQVFPGLGYCHTFWATKRIILRKKYGLEWKSPSELNPATIYD